MCVPYPLCWGVLCVPWPVGTTSGFFSTLQPSGHPLISLEYTTLTYSPSVSCSPEVFPENILLPTVVLVLPLCVSSNLQFASENHVVLSCAVRVGFLTSFCRSSNMFSSSWIGPPSSSTTGQVVLPLHYLWFLLTPSPLSSASIIWWSVNALSSLMHTL